MSTLFGGRFSGRRVLVTGHTGFKGAWLALWLEQLGAEVGGLALDPDTSPSLWRDLGLKLSFDTRTDLRDAAGVRRALAQFSPDLVIHLAAQSLVRRSYREPVETFTVNVSGLVNLYEAIRSTASVIGVVNATTDKVYEHLGAGEAFEEGASLGGHDPYSASKACAEIVSASYRRSFFSANETLAGVQLATARAGNVIGGGDWAEDRLVPDLVRATKTGAPLRLRNPNATRPWQHVLEPLAGYLCLGESMLAGQPVDEAWNFGPPPAASLPVGEMVHRLQRHWPGLTVELAPGPHPHEAAELRLDSRKAERRLGWAQVWDLDETMARTATWYKAHASGEGLRNRNDLAAYVAAARHAGLRWAT